VLGPALALLLLAGAGPPYRSPSGEPLDFRGPGRDDPEPDVPEVVLGWFGPGDPGHPEFGEQWSGATLALEQENAAGGYHGRPFRLEAAWSESPWKAGVRDVNRLVYEHGAWAVIGGVDGTTTHLAVQLALKSYFLLLSPGSTDATADHANVPWLFSLPPSDERIAPVLADGVAEASAGAAFAIVSGTDHDSRASLVALRRALAVRRLSPASVVEATAGAPDLPSSVARALEPRPMVLVVLSGAQASAAIVKAARAAGFAGPIVAGPAASRAAFARAAGAASAGVRAPEWIDRNAPRWRAFADAYAVRWHAAPDWAAASGYDAVRIVAAAVRVAGLNRARIRDAVRGLAPYEGAGGVVRWNPIGRNETGVRLAGPAPVR
jgi:branched-chain amino acid transport system substrate-binding protein